MFRDEDPPAQPKLAIPVSTITAISEKYRWAPHLNAVVDLTLIAFFYLLHVGEYTTPKPPKGQPPRAKWTIALRDCDIWMWRKRVLIPHSAGLTTLLMADSATICITNTKNGTKGAVVHHDAFGGPICPVSALAQRIANIQQAKYPECPINAVFSQLDNAQHWCLTMTLGLLYNGERRMTVYSCVDIPWTASLHIVCERGEPWL